MPQISGTVYDDAGLAADGRTVRAYRRDTGAMLSEAITPGISKPAYVAGSSTVYVTATSQTVSIPAQVEVGDLLLAWVMHRENLTPPSGWTLVRNATCSATGLARHDLSVYSRIAIGGDAGASTAWTQATSARLAVHIQAFRRVSIATVGSSSSQENNITAGGDVSFSSISASSNGLVVVHGASQVVSNASPTATTVSISAGTLTTPSSVADNRLFVGYRGDVNSGQSASGSFTTNLTDGGNNGKVKISVLVGESAGEPTSGQFKLDTHGLSGECNVVYLDDAAGTLYNDLIHRVMPG